MSQVYWFYIFVEMLPQPELAQECLMSITVQPSGKPNGGSKVKVLLTLMYLYKLLLWFLKMHVDDCQCKLHINVGRVTCVLINVCI